MPTPPGKDGHANALAFGFAAGYALGQGQLTGTASELVNPRGLSPLLPHHVPGPQELSRLDRDPRDGDQHTDILNWHD